LTRSEPAKIPRRPAQEDRASAVCFAAENGGRRRSSAEPEAYDIRFRSGRPAEADSSQHYIMVFGHRSNDDHTWDDHLD
jgi:hypothetical protein